MNEFLLVFRTEPLLREQPMSPEQMQAMMKPWLDWMGGLAAQNKLANSGNRLGGTGATVRPGGVVTDGPYVEVKEAIGGYVIVRADSLEEACELSKGCPVLQFGGNVEVRPIIRMDANA